MKIQKRLLLTILPIVFLTVVAVVGASIKLSTESIEEQVKDNAKLLSRSYSNQLNAKVVQLKRMSQDLASAIVTAVNAETVLIDARKRYHELDTIFYASKDGSVKDMAPYSSEKFTNDFSGFKEFQESIITKKTVLSNPIKYMGNEVFMVFSPVLLDYVRNKEVDVVGVIILVMTTDSLFEKFDEVVYGDTGSLFVINENGYFLSSKDKSYVMKKKLSDIPSTTKHETMLSFQNAMTSNNSGLATYYLDSRKHFICFSPVSDVNWSLSITGAYSEFTKSTNSIVITNILILIVGLIIASVFIYLTVRGVVRPITSLTEMAEQINKGEMSLRSNIKTKNEMGILSKSIDSMLETIEKNKKKLEITVDERTQELQATNEELTVINESLDGKVQEIAALNEELTTNNEKLDENNQEMEAINEELLTSNEALDKNNREMEAINEELTTSNETLDKNNREMEAMNEELTATVEQLDNSNRELEETKKALWSEMELAKKLQTVLLPEEPKISGFDISAFMNTTDKVGGDYYDVINVEGKDWFLIGDVSGHGVTAGLIMMMVQTSIHIALTQNPESLPGDLLTLINRTIHSNISKLGGNRYMTLTVFACMEDNKFSFAGAHLPVIIYRKESDSIEMMETPGAWIGLVDDIDMMNDNNEFVVNTGDVLLLYTDGISEAMTDTGEQFSQKALADLFKSSAHLSSKDICNVIRDYSECLTMDDDVTVMALKKVLV